MSQGKKRTMLMADTPSTLNMSTGSESRVEMQLSPHVTAGNQLIGKLLPEFSSEKGSPKLKSRPSTSQRRDLAYALVIPTAPNDVSDSWEGKSLPKVYSQPERIITKGYPRSQIPPAPPPTARELSSLKVVLKGKTVPKGPSGILCPIEKASKMLTAPPVTRSGTEISEIFSSAAPIPGSLALKPALLPCVGNVKSLPLTEKKKKLPKYKVGLKKAKTKLEPIIPEIKTEHIEMEIEPQEMNSERKQSSDMAEAQCAVRMLVQEAKVLTRDDTRPPSMKTKVKQKVLPVEIKEEIQSGSAPRSVDEIIDSLWEQVHSETISESDRRIQEIMNRVMSRGTAQKTEKIQEKSGEEPSEISDKSTQKQTIVEEEEKEVKEEGKETYVPPEQEDEQEEMVVTETEPTITEEDDVCITAVAGPWDIESLEEEDLNKLKAELNLPLHVTREDILSLKGQHVKTFPPDIVKKSGRKRKIEMSFLSSWNDADIITGGGKSDDPPSKPSTSRPNVRQHHFCTMTSEFEIRPPFTHVGWTYHTPNKFMKDFPIKDCRESLLNEPECLEDLSDAERKAEISNEILDAWLGQAEDMFTDIELTVKGVRAPTIMTNNIHFWTLSPPKLHILPVIIKQMMCPYYHGSFNPGRYTSFKNKKSFLKKSAAKKLLDNKIDKNEDEVEQLLRVRLLEQKSQSTRDMTSVTLQQALDLEVKASLPLGKIHKATRLTKFFRTEKCHSDTFCIKDRDAVSTLLLPSDFESLNTEIQDHKKSIGKMKRKSQEKELLDMKESSILSEILKEDPPLPANVKLKGKKKDKQKQDQDIPTSQVREYFKHKSPLQRSQSVISLKGDKVLKSLKVQRITHKSRSRSLISLELPIRGAKRELLHGVLPEEKFLSLPKTCRNVLSESMSDKILNKDLEEELSTYSCRGKLSKWSEPLSGILPADINKIDMSTDDPEKLELNKKMWAEIRLLTIEIENSPKNLIFDICRRGILYRKVGEIEKSFADLNQVIELESAYLDAYWHRHFLFILQGDYLSALDDLNYVRDRHPEYKTYMALAVLYEQLENQTMALANYTHAIQLDNSNYLAYFFRAKLYETNGNIKFAMSDFIKTAEKNPKHIEAVRKQAEYFLIAENWNLAISKSNRLLQMVIDPEVFLIRAEAFIGLKMWNQALSDVSTAIHLGPSLWKAFYLRGCLLKNDSNQMSRALMDFSISLLLNDSVENLACFSQRGILYVRKQYPEQAAADFASILEFDPNNISALLNFGLIHSKHFQNYTVAIMFFTHVISLNPFHIKAYQFRAQAYTKLFKYQSALRDYTRIIHLEPNNYKYYFFLGHIFLKLKMKDTASFILKLISNVDSSVGMSSELAAVFAYLNNTDMAISVLEEALEKNPGDLNLIMSLAKTQLQAKQYQNSLTTFKVLKEMMIMKKKERKWPSIADEVFFNLGLVYMELKEYKKALGAFNYTIEINPRHAPCFYNRGLAKIHLQYVHCVIDFNKALAIDPKYFEVYMSRAAYYDMKQNYTKAILNCNEGLKIYKTSVRALLYRGSIKYFIGAYQLAVVDLSKAIELKGDCALAFFNRAICFEALEEYEKALTDYSIVCLVSDDMDYNVYRDYFTFLNEICLENNTFEKVLAIQSICKQVFINRGCLYYQMEDFDNAREDFREASKLKFQDHRIIHAWGLCLHKMGKLDEAKEIFTKCIRINCQFADAYISRGNVYMDYVGEKETLLASRDYQRAIKVKPDDVLARICLGYALQISGKLMAAWHQFSEAFIIDPSCEEALEGRAVVCLQMGNTYAAFQDLNAAIRINPTAELYNNRGVVNQHMKCFRDAMTDYKHAIELDPEYALAYYNVANIYLHGRFFKQALTYFDDAIKLDPSDECAFINRAVTKVMLKDVEGASSDFAQALQMCPYYAHIYFNRGNLYASLQSYDLAEKDYTSALAIVPDDPLTLVQRANVFGKMGKKELAIADYRKAMELKEEMRNLYY